MADYLFYDLETKSEKADLKKVGTYRYAANPTTQLLCAALALDDEPIHLWKPGEKLPAKYTNHMKKGGLMVAHGAQFEIQIHRQKLTPVHNWPLVEPKQFRCSQSMALALALPPALENISEALGISEFKDKVGKRVMLQMTKPRKARKGEDPDEVHWYDDEERHGILQGYCMKDVGVMREAFDVMWPLSEDEQAIWVLDQVINDRGFYMDGDLLMAMRKIILDAAIDIDASLVKLTKGAVKTVGQVAQMKTWLETKFNLEIKSLNKATIPELLADKKVPQLAKDVLELRLAGAQAATKKVDAFLARRDNDGRARGSFLYHSAGTGRWASRGVQVHNLKRLTSEDEEEILGAVDELLTGDYKALKAKYARPLKIVGDNIRTVICAAPGNILIGADFSGIEARVTAWVAGEKRKIKVFQDYDAGIGPDPYVATAADVFGLSVKDMVELKKSDPAEYKIKRQGGKGGELAFGFQGGGNAFKKFVPESMLENTGPIEGSTPSSSDEAFQKRHGKHGIAVGASASQSRNAKVDPNAGKFSDSDVLYIRDKWRAAHPNTVKLWRALNEAAMEVAKHANRLRRGVYSDLDQDALEVKNLTFEHVISPTGEHFMFMVLPSGRRISYPGVDRAKNYKEFYHIEKPDADVQREIRGTMSSFFMDNNGGRYHRVFLYGGLICENAIQGIARDLLAAAMLRIEAAGYPIVAHVHDECVIEVPKKHAKKIMAEFVRLMCVLPDWAVTPDCPLPVVANGWMAERYVK